MPKRVAIIGGGPSGAATARALLAEPAIGDAPAFELELFEQRSTFGGLWNYSPTAGPMYRRMDANVPRELIAYSGFPFPEGEGYPSRTEVLRYLQAYAREVTRSTHINVHLSTAVQLVEKTGGQWRVVATQPNQPPAEVLVDYVVLATGHYERPYFPPIPGLKSHPGLLHSIDYDSPEEFRDQKVLIIGNARSGTDLAIQILGVTAPISVSRRRVGPSDAVFDEDLGAVAWKPEVERVDGRLVVFTDGSSEEYDRIVASTGYLYDFPFLRLPDATSLLHKSRLRFRNIYKHTFYSPDPTLATLAINKGMVPFPTMETQAAVIARVFSGRLALPSLEQMQADEKATEEVHGTGEKFHDLTPEQDMQFMTELWDWAETSPGGFTASRWTPEQLEFKQGAGKRKENDYRRKVVAAKALRGEWSGK